jgi:autotransporter-associated beta strand protein
MIRISFKTLSVGALLPALAAILVLSAPSRHADAQILYVGNGSSNQTTSFTSGTTTYTAAFIGNTSTDSNNTLNVLNPGTRLTINGGNVQVGFAGSGNSMVISNGGFVSDVNGVVSFGATGSNNSALVTGTGSTWSNSNQVRIGVSGSGTLTVANGGLVIASGATGIQVAVNANSMGVLNIGSYGGNDSAGSIVAPQIGFNVGTGYLNFNQTDTFTLTNPITGANTIFFQQLGSGTTILTGANSSANSTLISNGTLQIGDGGANGSIGSRAITNNSVLAINSSTEVTFGSRNGITGTGVLIQMGTGTTILTGSNTTYSGGTLISNGTLRVGAGPTGSLGDTNGSLGTGNVTNNATLAFSRRFASDTVSNNISGTGALRMFGSGVLTLAGSNSYSGLTTINSGYTLQIGTGGTNGTLGTGSVSNEGTLSFNRSDLYTASNAISGAGKLSQIGSGTTILLGSNSSSGETTVTNGMLQIGDGGTSGSVGSGGIALSGSGNLAFNRADSVTVANSIGGGGGTLSQIGSGTLILTGGGATYGGTVISNGTLQVGDGGANGSIGAGAITNNSVLAINSSTNIAFANNQAITGTGVLIQMGTGTTTLVANNTTYSGGTLISRGTLQVGSGANFATDGSLGTGNVTNNATLAFNRGLAGDTVFNNISGTGALRMFGSTASLTLAGSNSYSGLTTIDSGYTLQIGTGGANGTLGTGSVSNAGTLSFNRSDLYTVANAISGTGALSQIGSGTTILSGSNSSSGETAVTNGMLQIGDGGTTGSVSGGGITLSGSGNLAFNRADSVTVANSIAGGGGTLSQIGSGTLILMGSGANYGGTVISNGTLQIGDGGANGSIGVGAITNNSVLAINSSTNIAFANDQAITGTGVLVQMGTGTTTLVANNTTYSGGTLISRGTLQVGSGANTATDGSLGTGNVTNNATLAFNRGLASDTVSNNISGTGALTMFGSGGLTLVGSNSYSGLTTIGSRYTLQIGTGGTNGTLGTGSVSNAGTLSLNRSDLYTASNAISGTGKLSQIGTGTTILLGSNSYSGETTVTNGVLQIGNGGTTGSIAGDVVNNATLIFNRSDASTYSGTINGTGAVTKQGGGTLTLAGANSYSGGTTISDGVLALGSANAVGASGTILFGGGTLQYSASNTTDYSSRFSTAASQAYSIDTNGQNVTWASPLASSGGTLTKSGTGALTLAGANSYSGVTTISGGTLALSGAGSIGTGGLNLGSGGVFDLTARTSGTYSLPSTGDLIGSGTLTGNGRTLAVLGAFQPGNSPGTVTVDAGFTLDLSGATSTTFDITDPLFAAGTYDLVNGNGSTIFGGILNLTFSGSYDNRTDVLQLFSNTGGFSGDFTSVVSTGLAEGQFATFNADTGSISVVPEPSTYAMALAGLACGGWQMMRRRRLRQAPTLASTCDQRFAGGAVR